MTSTSDATSDSSTLVRGSAFRTRLAIFIPWMLVAVLVISNGTTLLSERVHAAAYGLVASVVQLAGAAAAYSMLSRSPAQTRARAVDRATRDLKTQNANYEARHRVLQADHTKLQNSKATLQKEHESLRTLTNERAAAVRNITTRTTVKLAARSAEAVASLPVRAVPYVGIAALVAFTAWEVTTDCELAHSLSDLAAEHENGLVDTDAVCKFVGEVPSADQAWSTVKSQANAMVKGAYTVIERYAPSSTATVKANAK